MFSIMLIPNIGMSFANHGDEGGSGGGGCKGDCTAPTLGKDSEGTLFVENGFTINDKSYDVEYFEQTISTQTVLENQPVEITLRVYENSGPQALKHVGIVLGNEYIFDSYVWRHISNVEISWMQEFDGSQSVKVENNDDQLVTDVDVQVQVEDDITVLKFQFTPTMAFDTSHIMVKMWDQNRGYWLNNFHDGLEIKSNPFSQKNNDVLTTESGSFGETSEVHEVPIESHEDEIHKEKTHEDEDSHDTKLTEEIHCDENSKAIIDSRFGNTLCAPINIATALIESGLAIAN